jgi:cysteine-rich repeat protein
MKVIAGAAMALAVAGCATQDNTNDDPVVQSSDADESAPADVGTSDASDEPDLYPLAYFSFTTATGEDPEPYGIFANREDVYFIATRQQGDPRDIEPADYIFEVIAEGGPNGFEQGSTDDEACRRFHVDIEGNVDHVYAANGCEHPFTVTADGKLRVKLAPYNWAPIASGYELGTYCVSFRRTDGLGGDAPCFNVWGACGDGSVTGNEACDDGNTADGDGCSATCQTEPPPCPTGTH